MDEEKLRAEYKKETLANWWTPTKSDWLWFAFTLAFNVMLFSISGMSNKEAFVWAIVTCLIFIPVGHVLAYLLIKKWG